MSPSGGAAMVPESLRAPDLQGVWAEVRARLDRYGPAHRSRMTTPAASAPGAALALRSLLGRAGSTIDLADLEVSLVRLGLGPDLDQAISALGWPPSPAAVARRRSRTQAREQREQIGVAVAGWPEPWAGTWAATVAASGALAGVAPDAVRRLVGDARRLLDAVASGFGELDLPARDEAGRVSRVDVAAQVLGSSHALDSRSLLERVCRRALALRLGIDLGSASAAEEPSDEEPSAEEPVVGDGAARFGIGETEVWERSGFHLDRLSSPILTWGLDLIEPSPIADLARMSTAAGMPFPITTLALGRHVPVGANRNPVLMVENPRVVEAAADVRAPLTVIATNGNPRRNLVMLVSDLLAAGTDVHYHGDFDSTGLAICHRMVQLGCRPWAMGAADYTDACRRAAERGVELPVDPASCGPTPWDPAMARAFNEAEGRRVVHEERLLGALLGFA